MSTSRHRIFGIQCLLVESQFVPHSAYMRHSSPNSTNRQIKPEYLGVDQAEIMSGLSRWTWRRYAYEGKIASVKAGKRLLIPVSEVRRVMAEGYRPAPEQESTQ